ncbi:hypothetical protein [Clostridium estertheticum]|uniref:hyaluronate lyase N-terminal domain-containing protein n=1 Tax=Clostridium estertheticum TaxID=238834 RepID=UPI001CF0FC52|nr:hypothetical protein [Clostridium estertheticum]MCB2354333.1 hypothetical protein [Clostridium estertheticum]WAG42548.1 hypothetical protein LL065_07705 [Clostridium estertheticum]
MIRTIQLKRYKLKVDLPILLEAEPALCLDTGEVFIGDGVNNIPLSKQGIQGIQGSQGIQGEKGDTGLQGSVGSTGIQGIQGLKGDIGITGANGSQGIQGIKGTDGSNGSQGIQGIQGIKGDTGAQGIQGLTGSGTGDMLKSVYDKDGNGIVDDAEKVGGYLPNVFALSSNAGHLTATALRNNTTLASGIYTNTGDGILNNDGSVFRNGWWHIIHMHHSDNNGYDAQIAIPLSSEDNIYYRHAGGGSWGLWKLLLDSSNLTKLSQLMNDIGAKTTTNATAPTTPSAGDFWYKIL